MTAETYSRRNVLRAGAGVAVGGAALGNARPARGQTALDGWLDGVENYDGVVDETGNDSVTIEVGVKANGGNFGFGPAAVRVDPGTTVTWKWVNGSHNVVDDAGNFESEMTSKTGFTFEQTFEETGVVKYFCLPHKSMGMKGAVVVGDADVGAAASGGSGNANSDLSAADVGTAALALSLVAGLLSPLAFAPVVKRNDGR